MIHDLIAVYSLAVPRFVTVDPGVLGPPDRVYAIVGVRPGGFYLLGEVSFQTPFGQSPIVTIPASACCVATWTEIQTALLRDHSSAWSYRPAADPWQGTLSQATWEKILREWATLCDRMRRVIYAHYHQSYYLSRQALIHRRLRFAQRRQNIPALEEFAVDLAIAVRRTRDWCLDHDFPLPDPGSPELSVAMQEIEYLFRYDSQQYAETLG